jgi:translation initiation factor IF-3
LTDGFQVRIKLLLRGRELGKIGMARELMIAFINSLEDATVAVEPKMQGKVFMAVVVRKAK